MEPVKAITRESIQETIKDGHIVWAKLMDGRQQKEIQFDLLYSKEFSHGTDGHNARLIIARMAEILNTISAHVKFE